MNIKRLEHLIEILTNVKPDNFYMQTWHCGTTACALGHAALDSEFKELGLEVSGNNVWFENTAGFEAGEHFFDITIDESRFLFNPGFYCNGLCTIELMDQWYYTHPNAISRLLIQPKHVIERIKWIISK